MSVTTQCCAIESIFDDKTARKMLKKYQRGKRDAATALLIKQLKLLQKGDETLLDIGSGIGVIPMELVPTGLSSITDVDASTGYLKVAKEESTRLGFRDRATYLHGDFLEVAPNVGMHDISTMDKVICCYDNAESLLTLTAQRTNRVIGLVYPRNTLFARIMQAVGRVYFSLRQWAFRFHMHKDEMINRILAEHHFRELSRETTFLWQVRVFVKE